MNDVFQDFIYAMLNYKRQPWNSKYEVIVYYKGPVNPFQISGILSYSLLTVSAFESFQTKNQTNA